MKMNKMLALAAVAMLTVACGEDAKTTPAGDTATTGDTATVDTGADAVAPAGDATVVVAACSLPAAPTDQNAKGCTPNDKAYLGSFATAECASEGKKFRESNKTCTLGGCFPKGTDTEGAECVGKCIVSKGHPITNNCANCYGGFAYCTAKNCLTECAKDSNTPDCVKCQADKGCTKTKDDCVSGK